MSASSRFPMKNGRPVLLVWTLEPSSIQPPMFLPTGRQSRPCQISRGALSRLSLVTVVSAAAVAALWSAMPEHDALDAYGSRTAASQVVRELSETAPLRRHVARPAHHAGNPATFASASQTPFRPATVTR
jgi:hypothetical protein